MDNEIVIVILEYIMEYFLIVLPTVEGILPIVFVYDVSK